MIVLDDSAALRADPLLLALLAHYVALADANREAWHQRVSDWGGSRPAELSRWHGRLIAADWVEQNTGAVPTGYRATATGRRAVRSATATE